MPYPLMTSIQANSSLKTIHIFCHLIQPSKRRESLDNRRMPSKTLLQAKTTTSVHPNKWQTRTLNRATLLANRMTISRTCSLLYLNRCSTLTVAKKTLISRRHRRRQIRLISLQSTRLSRRIALINCSLLIIMLPMTMITMMMRALPRLVNLKRPMLPMQIK